MNQSCLALITSLLLLASSIKATELTVGVESIDYMPYSTIQNKQYSGFYRQLLDKFAQDSGHTLSYKPLPVKRLTADFLAGKVDFKLPDSPLWAQDLKSGKAIIYSTPITTYIDGIMVLPANKGKPYKELTSISTVRGFTPFPFLKDIQSGAMKVNEANSLDSIIKMVESGRVNGGFVNVAVAKYFVDNELKQPGKFVYDNTLPKGVSDISLSSLQHARVIEEFNLWMANNSTWISQLKTQFKID